jgi:hypothetical protein
MSAKHGFAAMAVIGTVLPLWQLFPFLRDHGLAPQAFVEQLFSTPVSAFFGMDVIVSTFVLWSFIFVDGRRTGVRHRWLPVVASLIVGVSLGLPLFLYMRERYVEMFPGKTA